MIETTRATSQSGRSDLQRNVSIAPTSFLMQQHSYVAIVTVLVISLCITAAAISKSYLVGKLATPMTHNDVNYVIDGIRRLLYIELNGFWAELSRLYRDLMHAPLSGYQAALGFYLFGFEDWAPYATNIIYLFIFFGVCVWLLRGTPDLIVIAVLLAVAGMPLMFSTVSEFAPETPCGLFTALGVLLTLRIHTLDWALRARLLAGLCFGLGFLGKPSSFVFVPLVASATLGVAFLRDVLWTRQFNGLVKGIYHGVLHLLLSLWLPALYVIPYWNHYSQYFHTAVFDPENVKAFGGGNMPLADSLLFYLTGTGGEYVFGNFLWAYVGTIALGLAAASMRRDRAYILRQLELMMMVVILWLPPTASAAKSGLFGTPFSFLIAFMVVIALRSIYESGRRLIGVITVTLLSFLLLVSPTSRYTLANTPGFFWDSPNAPIIREKWIEAMDRFTAVILGNAPNYHSGNVYITNPGYYHIPVLQYAFLKKDPSLQWTFWSYWTDPNPQHHIDFIHQSKQDFIIAGEHGNGLTYAPPLIPGSAASEDNVLAALWKDPEYMPIDQFYGPGGRTITIFQRRVAFGGWRPLNGLQNGGTTKPWIGTGTVIYLEAYAPTAVPAELIIDANGPSDQSIDIIINRQRSGQLAFDSSGKAFLTERFNLTPGQNDIVLQKSWDAPVRFDRLLVIRKMNQDGIRSSEEAGTELQKGAGG